MAIRITATLWNCTRREKDQDSISQGKNSNEGYENNYASSVLTGTLGQELPEKRWTQTIQRTSQELATREENCPLANQTKY